MFTYLRYFSAISSVVIMLAAFVAGLSFRSLAEADLEALVAKNNTSLAQGFINSTWKAQWSSIEQLYQLPITDWKNYREFVAFSRSVFLYFEDTPVAKVNLYSPKGALILSTDQSEIVMASNEGNKSMTQGFAAATQGTVTTQTLEDVSYRTAGGQQTTGTLVRTLVPIIADSYVPSVLGSESTKASQVQGVVEIFLDVTPQWKRLYLFQVLGTGGIIVIFLVLIIILIATSRRAEAIIAKQHEANVELAAQAAAAETENQNKTQFLANISHELRTPLNAIIGFSEIMKTEMMGSFENNRYQDYIKDIHGSGVHLLSLINDILDYSKAEAGKLEMEIAEVDATKVILNSMRLVSPRAEAAEVRLLEEIPKEHIVLKTDAKKLKQVLLNLLSNAVKFTPPGGEVKISAWHNVLEKTLSIRVADTGIGIAPKDISRAMSPFGQVDSALSRKHEGTGLGLPLTYKFTKLLGGDFDIESELNKGTTITITLPLSGPEIPDAPRPAPSKKQEE